MCQRVVGVVSGKEVDNCRSSVIELQVGKLSLVAAAASILFVVTKFCCDKTSFVMTKVCLSRQNIFVATKLLSRQIFVAVNIVLSQQKFYRDKHVFVTTKHIFCRDKVFKCYFCCDKSFVATNTCINIILLRQTYFCRDKRRALV